MVSFVCDECQETIKKPKLDNHKLKCRRAVFSCIDCSKTFHGLEYKDHTSCMTEKEKYEKPKKLNSFLNPKSESIIKSLEKSNQSDEIKSIKINEDTSSKINADKSKDILSKILKKKSVSYQKLEKKCAKRGLNLGKLLLNSNLSLQNDLLVIQLQSGNLV